jgi:hypothetical protein
MHQFKLLIMNTEALKARYHDKSVPAEAEEANAFADHVIIFYHEQLTWRILSRI